MPAASSYAASRRASARAWAALATVACLVLLTGCVDRGAADSGSTEPPQLGACRDLTPDDLTQPSNADPVVACDDPHTAETYAVGSLPDSLGSADRGDPRVEAYAYEQCARKLGTFLGADESLVMRTMVSWAWFRPDQTAWEKDARWYRCDAVGGGPEQDELLPLPRTAKGLLLGKPGDKWLVCGSGSTLDAGQKVPCSSDHTWRAATTIKLGNAEDPYPGDEVAQQRTSDFCKQSIDAFLGYPDDFDFAYTWFQEREWEAGNRRSVCWAKTEE